MTKHPTPEISLAQPRELTDAELNQVTGGLSVVFAGTPGFGNITASGKSEFRARFDQAFISSRGNVEAVFPGQGTLTANTAHG